EAERKKIQVDFLFLLAVIWAANALWQYGFSASAPLLVASPGHFLESLIGIVPLSTTIWSPAAIIHELVFTAALIVIGCWLMPKKCRTIAEFPESYKIADVVPVKEPAELSFSERLERNSVFTLLLCAGFASWLYYHFFVKGMSLDINALNTTLLLLSFLLHKSVKRFTDALQQAVSTSWPVIVLYHLYAGVAGLIQYTDVGER